MSALTFKYVKYKNILSTGDSFTRIDLNTHLTTLVIGTNGAGKSTMLDAICFALYGKPFRNITKPQLVNSINKKQLVVELAFHAHGRNYIIKRGIKPNIFEIYQNDELINQDAAARDYQKYLEENILKMDIKSFGQIVVLGSASYVPFMQLPAAQRRTVIEDMLDIQIFSEMNVLLKERVKVNASDIRDVTHSLEMAKGLLDTAKRHNAKIKEMKEDRIDELKSSAKPHLDIIKDNKKIIEDCDVEIIKFDGQVADINVINTRIREYETLIGNHNREIKSLEKDNAFFHDNDDCPTCRQRITDDFKTNTIDTNAEKIENEKRSVDTIKGELTRLEDERDQINEIQKQIDSHKSRRRDAQISIDFAKKSLETIKASIIKAQEDSKKEDLQEVDSLLEDIKKYEEDKTDLEDKKNTLAVVAIMLKDGGIKTNIVKQYVPIMNKLINKYLAQMEFFVEFSLDENFNETIKSRYRDVFSYASFSEGEKLRIDLALMFTWRAISRMRNSVSTNLLLMDEIMDSSLDDAGTDDFLKIIKDLTEDSNIFIISHKGQQLDDKFDRTIRFKKVKNFSMMDI